MNPAASYRRFERGRSSRYLRCFTIFELVLREAVCGELGTLLGKRVRHLLDIGVPERFFDEVDMAPTTDPLTVEEHIERPICVDLFDHIDNIVRFAVDGVMDRLTPANEDDTPEVLYRPQRATLPLIKRSARSATRLRTALSLSSFVLASITCSANCVA